ncbi:hypothetical protein BKA69DRAFT_1048946 [Paraphysoderma sedebokerense]|nr:hypothetical protein BKA69DRAFT_1048946 [Paraphysoderma sedebokerense]
MGRLSVHIRNTADIISVLTKFASLASSHSLPVLTLSSLAESINDITASRQSPGNEQNPPQDANASATPAATKIVVNIVELSKLIMIPPPLLRNSQAFSSSATLPAQLSFDYSDLGDIYASMLYEDCDSLSQLCRTILDNLSADNSSKPETIGVLKEKIILSIDQCTLILKSIAITGICFAALLQPLGAKTQEKVLSNCTYLAVAILELFKASKIVVKERSEGFMGSIMLKRNSSTDITSPDIGQPEVSDNNGAMARGRQMIHNLMTKDRVLTVIKKQLQIPSRPKPPLNHAHATQSVPDKAAAKNSISTQTAAIYVAVNKQNKCSNETPVTVNDATNSDTSEISLMPFGDMSREEAIELSPEEATPRTLNFKDDVVIINSGEPKNGFANLPLRSSDQSDSSGSKIRTNSNSRVPLQRSCNQFIRTMHHFLDRMEATRSSYSSFLASQIARKSTFTPENHIPHHDIIQEIISTGSPPSKSLVANTITMMKSLSQLIPTYFNKRRNSINSRRDSAAAQAKKIDTAHIIPYSLLNLGLYPPVPSAPNQISVDMNSASLLPNPQSVTAESISASVPAESFYVVRGQNDQYEIYPYPPLPVSEKFQAMNTQPIPSPNLPPGPLSFLHPTAPSLGRFSGEIGNILSKNSQPSLHSSRASSSSSSGYSTPNSDVSHSEVFGLFAFLKIECEPRMLRRKSTGTAGTIYGITSTNEVQSVKLKFTGWRKVWVSLQMGSLEMMVYSVKQDTKGEKRSENGDTIVKYKRDHSVPPQIYPLRHCVVDSAKEVVTKTNVVRLRLVNGLNLLISVEDKRQFFDFQEIVKEIVKSADTVANDKVKRWRSWGGKGGKHQVV